MRNWVGLRFILGAYQTLTQHPDSLDSTPHNAQPAWVKEKRLFYLSIDDCHLTSYICPLLVLETKGVILEEQPDNSTLHENEQCQQRM